MRLQFSPFVRLHHLLEFLRKPLPPADVFLELVEAERPHRQPDLQRPELAPSGHLRESRFVVKVMTRNRPEPARPTEYNLCQLCRCDVSCNPNNEMK